MSLDRGALVSVTLAGLLTACTDAGSRRQGLDVPLPVEHGRWLLSLSVHWQTDCARGDGYVDLLLVT